VAHPATRLRAMAGLEDFDCYCQEHGIPVEYRPDALALWVAKQTDGRVPDSGRVAPGGEQILPDRLQRELNGVSSFLSLLADEGTDSP
jgi:hypothetical protein